MVLCGWGCCGVCRNAALGKRRFIQPVRAELAEAFVVVIALRRLPGPGDLRGATEEVVGHRGHQCAGGAAAPQFGFLVGRIKDRINRRGRPLRVGGQHRCPVVEDVVLVCVRHPARRGGNQAHQVVVNVVGDVGDAVDGFGMLDAVPETVVEIIMLADQIGEDVALFRLLH